MWLGGCKASLYISTNLVALSQKGQAGEIWSDAPWQQGLEAAAILLARAKHRRVAVWLSGGLARPFLIPATQGLKRWKEVEQLAAALAPAATQMNEPVSVWIGKWRGEQQSSLAVVVNQELQQIFAALRHKHGITPTVIAPAWRWAAMQAAPDGRMVLINEPDALTALRFTDGRPEWVSTYTPPPKSDAKPSFLARLAFAQSIDQTGIGWADILPTARTDSFQHDEPPAKLIWRDSLHAH